MELVFTDHKGQVEKLKVFDFKSPGIALAMYNLDDSIASFAHSNFQVCIQNKLFNKMHTFIMKIFIIGSFVKKMATLFIHKKYYSEKV